MPNTATAAIAAGRPTPRPLAGSIGPATIAVRAGLGAALGSWIGPGGETGGWMTPPGPGVGDRLCLWCFGVGATCGPVPPDGDWVGVGANDGVGVAVRDGDGAGDGRAPTVMEPWAVPGPLVAVTPSRPDDVATKL